MDSAAVKLELLERLASVKDETIIQQMSDMLKKAFPEVMEEEDDITDEEYVAFEEVLVKRARGEIKFHTEEEFFKLVHSPVKG